MGKNGNEPSEWQSFVYECVLCMYTFIGIYAYEYVWVGCIHTYTYNTHAYGRAF